MDELVPARLSAPAPKFTRPFAAPGRLDGLAIAGIPENDGHLSPWQEAVGHEIIPDTHKNGCANEATTGLTLGLFVMMFQDLVFG